MVIEVDRTVVESAVDDFTEPSDGPQEVESRWRWCPTSKDLLIAAEKRVFSNIKTPFKTKFINIGTTVGSTESKIWTLIFNEESNRLPLVLLHGFASGVGLWCLNLDTFAKSRPVYAIDLLGFGRSSRPQFSSNALEAERQLIQSIEEWRNRMGLEKFILMGHSMGGFLASSYAIQYPDRVAHVVLADPWGFPEKPVDATSRRPFFLKVIACILQPFNPLWILRASGPLGPRLVQRVRPDIPRKFSSFMDEADSIIPQYIYHCNAQNPSGEGAFHAMMDSFGWAKFPMVNRIAALREDVPITFIYGTRSWVDHKTGHQLKDSRKHVSVFVIEGAGHHVYADNYEEFNQIVLNECESAESY